MSLPHEKRASLIGAKCFLEDLLNPKRTPRVQKKYRREALIYLRHYPSDAEIQQLKFLGERDA